MKNLIKSFAGFFAKDGVLNFAFVATILLFGTNMIYNLVSASYLYFFTHLIFVGCVIFLFASFKKHNKNAQKGLMGAILMWYLYDEISFVVGGIVLNPYVFATYSGKIGMTYIVVSLLTAVLFACLFVNHFIINSDHHSRPVNVFINQLLVIIIAVISALSIPIQRALYVGQGWNPLGPTLWHTSLIFYVLLIAAYESRMDAYRIDREAAGWTEETGYPEGYERGEK